MRKLKLFFACLLMAVLSIGQVWGQAAAGTTLFSENFGGYENNAVPSGEVSAATGYRVIYGTNAKVTYTCTNGAGTKPGSTYVTTANEGNLAGGTSPELMVGKKGTGTGAAGGSFSIAGIPSGGAQEITVSYKQNAQNLSVSISGTGYSTTFTGGKPSAAGERTFDITVADGADATFTLTFQAAATSNVRVDDILITVKTAGEGGGPAKTLTSIAVSGTPTKTSYYAGDEFDPAGLTVTGHYSDNTDAPITSGITWSYDPSQELALNQTSIDVIATVSEIASPKFNVTGLTVSAAPAAATYEKVTSTENITDGDYLIVYEDGNVVLNGALTSLDAVGNTVAVTINDGVITGSVAIDAATVTINTTAKTIQTASGYYIGVTSYSNGLSSSTSNAYEHQNISIDGGNVLIYFQQQSWNSNKNGKMQLCYNSASDQRRFRYFKEGTQKAIQLYKKVDGSTVKPSAELSYAEADQKKLTKLGDAFTAPTLNNPHTVAVTYASDNTTVAEVASDGAVTIKAVGVATITASYNGSGDYKEGSASYTIGVTTHAGTEADPYNAIDTKNVIDVMGTKPNAYVSGKISSIITTSSNFDAENGYIWFYISDDGATTGQQIEAFKCLGLSSAKFTAVTDVVEGATVIITGTLKKYQSTYELDQDCYLVSYTAPEEPKTPIVSDIDNPITVANAITYIDAPATYDLSQAVWVRGVVTNIGQTNGQTPIPYIDVKDANAENSFRFFNYTINASITEEPQAGDILIATGLLDKYNSIYELNGCEVVSLVRPDVAVESIELDQASASIEVNETVTLHATVNPDNASNKAITWSVQSGSDYATVADGVVTGVAEGTAVIRAASKADPTKYAECTVTVNAADPTKHVVTFDATIDISDQETSITKSGITITASKFNNNEEGKYYYQCYASSAMTVSSTVGNITNIELTCTASGTAKYGPGNWDFTGYSYDGTNGSWAGSAETVEFGTASQQVRMTLITVTYKEDNRAAAGLAWNPADDIEITVGDAFSAPALQNPNSIDAAEITIESSNTSLATVTAGVVALVADATGEATITATFAGNDDYKPATVSYNITVNAAAPTPLTDYYEKVTETAGIVEGTYLIVYEDGENSLAFNGGLETLDAESNTIAVAITNDNKIGVTTETAAATFYIDPVAGTVKSASNHYIGVNSWSNGLKQTDTYVHNVLEIDGDGNAQVGIYKADWNTTGGTMRLQYNKGAGQTRFRYFKNGGQQPIALYKLHDEVIKPAAGLAWNPSDNIEITVGDAFTAPTLLNPNSIDAAEISIESSNTSLATVTAGVVALVADATGEATITATFAGNASYKEATVSYTIKVNPASSIYVSPSLNVNFGSVNQNAEVADKSITVTLTGVDAATLTLEGTGASAFTISPAAALTASGDITISASSATAGTFAATLTISDDASEAASRVVNLSLTVVDPATVETAISTTSEWVPATEIADGMQVIITGVKDNVTYAMGEQKNTNRAAYEATIDGEGVLTPGEGTMAFTLVAQGDGTYAIRTSNGQYLYAAKSDANHLKTQDEVDVNAKWTLTTTSAVAEGSSNRNIMRFNGGSSKLFSCYNSGQEDIKFYVPKPVVTYVAQIGETMYESLPAAVAAAQDGQTVNLLMNVAAGPGVMITTAEHKQIIIDFGNHTYCANSPAVGSAGTQNQAFHFEKGCNITLQNGTITSSGDEIKMLIQNYGDLTLLNMTLIGNNLPGTHRYVLSNNCGNVVIGDGTTITAKEGDVAFDVCVTNYYPEGTTVTVKEGATITGIVEYDVWGTKPADNKATLTIEGGNFNITWNVESALAEDAKDNINVSGGTFSAEVPADYCAPGYIPEDNGSGQYGVHYVGYYERGSLTPGNYATICLPNGGKISGASLFDIEYCENSTLYLLEVEGNTMVAGRPYIFLPSVEKIKVIYTDAENATAGTYNGLVGSLSLVAVEIAANDGNYILLNNQYYFVNSEAYVGANRAYIHMAGVPTQPSQQQGAPRRRVAMQVNGQNTTTGVDQITNDQSPITNKVIIDGRLFIIRGEKMYNANGQLVK